MEPNYIEQQESYIAELRTRCASAESALATMIEQKEYFRQCWEAAEAALAERDKPCVWAWSEFEQAWEAQCDGWLFTEYYEGDWSHCPRCGHRARLQEKVQP